MNSIINTLENPWTERRRLVREALVRAEAMASEHAWLRERQLSEPRRYVTEIEAAYQRWEDTRRSLLAQPISLHRLVDEFIFVHALDSAAGREGVDDYRALLLELCRAAQGVPREDHTVENTTENNR